MNPTCEIKVLQKGNEIVATVENTDQIFGTCILQQDGRIKDIRWVKEPNEYLNGTLVSALLSYSRSRILKPILIPSEQLKGNVKYYLQNIGFRKYGTFFIYQ
tara:strand:+ start:384 stop:689 length:306 start_codon:yes stop_codon:yes gene_type:complete